MCFFKINYSGSNNYIKNNEGEKKKKYIYIGYKYDEKKWNNYIYLYIEYIFIPNS